MRVSQIAEIIESIAPKNLALDFDNVGLIIGDENEQVTGVITTVDITKPVLDYACHCGCNLIISHHPLIFNAKKSILKSDYVGEMILTAIKYGINIYAAHTNMDKADYGINFCLADALNGENIHSAFSDGIGVMFNLNNQNIATICQKINTVTNGGVIRYHETTPKLYKSLALISGCGGRDESVIKYLIDNKIELFITSEFKNNIEIELQYRNINYIEYNHSDSERIFEDIIYNLLAETDVKVLKWSCKEV